MNEQQQLQLVFDRLQFVEPICEDGLLIIEICRRNEPIHPCAILIELTKQRTHFTLKNKSKHIVTVSREELHNYTIRCWLQLTSLHHQENFPLDLGDFIPTDMTEPISIDKQYQTETLTVVFSIQIVLVKNGTDSQSVVVLQNPKKMQLGVSQEERPQQETSQDNVLKRSKEAESLIDLVLDNGNPVNVSDQSSRVNIEDSFTAAKPCNIIEEYDFDSYAISADSLKNTNRVIEEFRPPRILILNSKKIVNVEEQEQELQEVKDQDESFDTPHFLPSLEEFSLESEISALSAYDEKSLSRKAEEFFTDHHQHGHDNTPRKLSWKLKIVIAMLLFGFLYLLHDILAGQTSKKSVRMQQEKKGADSRPRGTRKSRHK